MTAKHTIEYLQEYMKNIECELLSTEYCGVDSPLKVKCKCGNTFFRSFHNFTDGAKYCPECHKKAKQLIGIIPLDIVKEKLLAVGYKYIGTEEDYHGTSENMDLENIENGYRYSWTLSNTLRNCEKGDKFSGKFKEYNFSKWLETNNLNYNLVKLYRDGNRSMALVKCKTCGKERAIGCSPSIFGKDHKCICEKIKDINLTKTHPEIAAEWNYAKNIKPPEWYTYGQYVKVWWICENGHEYETEIRSRTTAETACPVCGKTASKGERKVRTFLESNNIPFAPQYSFPDCVYVSRLRFDFYIPVHKGNFFLIEYDGEQHFMEYEEFKETFYDKRSRKDYDDMKARDAIKNDYCAKNNIYLLRIPYWEYDNIEVILSTELAKYNLM